MSAPSVSALPAPAAAAAEVRGTTTVADKVVEKIAARCAVDVAHAEGFSRRVAGREFGSPSVRATAQVDGHLASLELDLAVEYPASVRATTRAVRAHVIEQLRRMCELTVDHVDISVVVLRRPRQDRRRVL